MLDGGHPAAHPRAGVRGGWESELAEATEIPWTISNKYYSANVHFVAHTVRELNPNLIRDVPAMVFVWTKGEAYRDDVERLAQDMQAYEPEVLLGVRMDGQDEEDGEIDDFLSSHGFEYVSVTDEGRTTTQGNHYSMLATVPDFPRVIDALSSIMWPSMMSGGDLDVWGGDSEARRSESPSMGFSDDFNTTGRHVYLGATMLLENWRRCDGRLRGWRNRRSDGEQQSLWRWEWFMDFDRIPGLVVTAMSTREDITPWEFQTVPPSVFRSSPAASTGLVQDVTPWELYPVPTPAVPEPIPRKSKRSRRPSGSLAGLTLAGRSNKGKRPVQYSPQSPADSFSYHYTKASSTASFHTSPPMPLSSVFLGLKKTLSAPKIEPRQSASHDPRFSTVDRKILQELKHNISAREAQFVKKGRCPSFGANGVVAGKKHHPYSRRDVPYPRNYEREVLDLDVWETAFCHDACGTVTWHVFKTPPTRVLDLGCGTGSWILSCAKLWKDCHFVGLDIVPLHPDLLQIGSPDLASRITWVQANFLETLPFPDDEFDYVHVKRIALGVPEDKWDPLLEEITRVMKPGAAFELIEEDLFFPGKHVDSDCDTDLDDQVARPFAEDHQSSSEVMPTGADDEVSTPTTVTSMLLATPSRPSSPVPIREVAIAEMDEDVASLTRTRGSISSRGTPTPRPSLQVKTSHESWAQIQPPVVPKRSTSTLSLPTRQSVISPRQPNTSTSTAPATPIEASELLQTVSKPPINPRDHTILEMIYTEMLSSRFINQSPLSLLTNSLSLYFKDLRTHPAIQFTFPPLPPRKFRVFGKVEERQLLGEVEQKKPASDDEMYEYEDEVYERSRFLSMQSLLQHESPYVSLDETRPTAFAPSSLVNLHKSAREMKVAAIRRASRLPNGQLNLDLKTLNLHLALRVLEVLACAESMWEWVREEQRNIRSVEAVRLKGRSRSRRRTSLSSDVSGRFRERIADMTRDDFDDLTSNFRFDMQDQYMPGYALRDRFDWSISLCLPPPDRIAYDAACEKWRSWQEGQGTAAMPLHSTSAFTRPRVISSGNSSVSPPQIVRAHSGQSGQSGGSSTLVSPPPPPPPPSLSSVQGERWDQSLYRHDASHESLLVNPQTGRTRSLTHVSQVPPTSKMSRALKVFVGWKP